jgi:Uma2 family endonuclease
MAAVGGKVCLTGAPEICVEVLSPRNSRREMKEKMALYFAAGAGEVWFCQPNGIMSYFLSPEGAEESRSALCPNFPDQV